MLTQEDKSLSSTQSIDKNLAYSFLYGVFAYHICKNDYMNTLTIDSRNQENITHYIKKNKNFIRDNSNPIKKNLLKAFTCV